MLAGKAGSSCLLSGSGRVMCVCKQPFAQVWRGATEREYTFIPFLMVMHQKSRLVSLCFSRQRWSGSLGFFVLFWTHLGPTKTPTLTPPEKSLLYSYLIFECVCLLLLCTLLPEWRHLESRSFVLFSALSSTSANRCRSNGQVRFAQSPVQCNRQPEVGLKF